MHSASPSSIEPARPAIGWPDAAIGLLTTVIFLGVLGSPGLWGKREQRAVAEALDTVEGGRWLVARIQGRPRLEKPPFPRWCVATCLALTGRREEWIVRLPGALAGMTTVGLVYAFGCGLGGRRVGRSAAMILATTGLFVAEMRQAGNDGMLTMFTTWALFAAWCRLQEVPAKDLSRVSTARNRGMSLLLHLALGLGFLSKGPVIFLLTGLVIIPYLITTGTLGPGLRRLFDPVGLALLALLVLTWPVAVLVDDPNALSVWLTEIGQKTGMLPIGHRDREAFLLQWPAMVLPWTVLAVAGLVMPFASSFRINSGPRRHLIWFPWYWSIGFLILLPTWAVAKPSYYLPCMPGLALISGMSWVFLGDLARLSGRSTAARRASVILGMQVVILALVAVVLPALFRKALPFVRPEWSILLAASLLGVIIAGTWLWTLGKGELALLPVMTVAALGGLLVYGVILPVEDSRRSHQELGQTIDRLVPSNQKTIVFLPEIDEGLWFYLRGRQLEPISAPGRMRYSPSHDVIGRRLVQQRFGGDSIRTSQFQRPLEERRRLLQEWLTREQVAERPSYLILKTSHYRALGQELRNVSQLLCEKEGIHRPGLVLLRTGPLQQLQANGHSPSELLR